MHDDQRRDDKRQQIVQREEAVQRGVVHRGSAQQPGLDRFTHKRDCAKQAGDHGRTPEGHLTPRQNVAHEGSAHHHQVNQHTDDPRDLTRGFVRAVEQAAEDVDIDRNKEQRRAVHVQIAQHIAAIHVAHDVFDAGKGQIDMRGVVHHQNDTGDDLQRQAERQNDAPDPPPVQVLGGGDHEGVIKQADDGQAAVQPLFAICLRLVMIVGNSGHKFGSPLAEFDGAGVRPLCGRNGQVFRCGAFADTSGQCRSANRGRGRTSRQSRQHRPAAHSQGAYIRPSERSMRPVLRPPATASRGWHRLPERLRSGCVAGQRIWQRVNAFGVLFLRAS